MRVGAAALVLVAVAVLGYGPPTGASPRQDGGLTLLDADLTPSDVAAGDEVTVTSIDGCAEPSGSFTTLAWAVFPAGAFAWEDGPVWDADDALASGYTDPEFEAPIWGAWSVTFPAPAATGTDDVPQAPGAGDPVLGYGPLPFMVDGDVELEFVAKCISYELTPMTAEITPSVPSAGQAATVTSVDPCPAPARGSGELTWELLDSDPLFDVIDSGAVGITDDGTWEIDLTAPEPGTYAVWAKCFTPEGGLVDGYFLVFDVTENGEPPTEPRPPFPNPDEVTPPPPAVPVVRPPDQTG